MAIFFHVKTSRRIWQLDTVNFWIGASFLLYLGIIALSYSVNMPIQDEWEQFRPGKLDRHLNLSWLFEFHNEHRIVFTKLLTWTLLRVGDLNLHVQVVCNFFMYAGICLALIYFLRRRLNTPASFLIPLLACGLTYEIHMWSFQSHFHFYMIFFMLGLWLLLRTDAWQYGAPFTGGCCAFSFGAGVVCASFLVFFALALSWRRPAHRKRCIVLASLLTLMVIGWFRDYPSNPIAQTRPWDPLLWQFVGAQLARGFGYDSVNLWPIGLIIIALGISLSVFYMNAWCKDIQYDDAWLAVAIYCLAGLATVVIVAISRASLGIEQARSSRYMQGILLLLPAFWVLLYPFLRRYTWLTAAVATILWLPFLNEFDYARKYSSMRSYFICAKECVSTYYSQGGEAICPYAYPHHPIPDLLDRARELRATFATASGQKISSKKDEKDEIAR